MEVQGKHLAQDMDYDEQDENSYKMKIDWKHATQSQMDNVKLVEELHQTAKNLSEYLVQAIVYPSASAGSSIMNKRYDPVHPRPGGVLYVVDPSTPAKTLISGRICDGVSSYELTAQAKDATVWLNAQAALLALSKDTVPFLDESTLCGTEMSRMESYDPLDEIHPTPQLGGTFSIHLVSSDEDQRLLIVRAADERFSRIISSFVQRKLEDGNSSTIDELRTSELYQGAQEIHEYTRDRIAYLVCKAIGLECHDVVLGVPHPASTCAPKAVHEDFVQMFRNNVPSVRELCVSKNLDIMIPLPKAVPKDRWTSNTLGFFKKQSKKKSEESVCFYDDLYDAHTSEGNLLIMGDIGWGFMRFGMNHHCQNTTKLGGDMGALPTTLPVFYHQNPDVETLHSAVTWGLKKQWINPTLQLKTTMSHGQIPKNWLHILQKMGIDFTARYGILHTQAAYVDSFVSGHCTTDFLMLFAKASPDQKISSDMVMLDMDSFGYLCYKKRQEYPGAGPLHTRILRTMDEFGMLHFSAELLIEYTQKLTDMKFSKNARATALSPPS